MILTSKLDFPIKNVTRMQSIFSCDEGIFFTAPCVFSQLPSWAMGKEHEIYTQAEIDSIEANVMKREREKLSVFYTHIFLVIFVLV